MCESKHCAGCGETKALADFGFRPSRGVYRSRCKDCRRVTERERFRVKSGYYDKRGREMPVPPEPVRAWVRTIPAMRATLAAKKAGASS